MTTLQHRRRSILALPSFNLAEPVDLDLDAKFARRVISPSPSAATSRHVSGNNENPTYKNSSSRQASMYITNGRLDEAETGLAMADLDFYYGLVKRQLLRHQSPTTGLFPEYADDDYDLNEGARKNNVGSIRVSLYANMAVWSLYQAYKRIDDDRGKSYELGQSTVLGLRGILACWMHQADKLECFKRKQVPEHALHSNFDLTTGAELDDQSALKWNHLQIDVVSLYLLFLVQSINSGLQPIYTMDEVDFVQNLVYYVERAYRTPDFGMWERGSKYNVGKCEINASSIGFAKAALEAINGCNLFGSQGASWSVIYVDIDAHNRNRSIFETLLPRESASKGVDIALLPTISFPAFATHEPQLCDRTRSKIESLRGRYGFRRFIRDGYGSVLEEGNERAFYELGHLQEFDGVESQWPMFDAFMVIDGVFRGKEDQVDMYQKRLRKRLSYNDFGDPVLPQYFYVPSAVLEDERLCPDSQHRIASNDGSSLKGVNLWAQSVLIISDLLTSHLLTVHELDPIRRHLPSFDRPKIGSRYSAFEKGGGKGLHSKDLVVQVVTLAESMRLQAVLATYGIQTQTPNEVEPVQIWSQAELVKRYEQLGRNDKLGLKGRPPRPVGSLGTSKVYRVSGQTVLCYPLIFSASDFYLSHDMALLTSDIRSELKFISKCWRLSGRPTVCLIITENNMRDPQFNEMLFLLSELRTGNVDGVKVRLGRLQNLVASSCLEHLDFLSEDDKTAKCFRQLRNEHIGYQALTDIPVLKPIEEEPFDIKMYEGATDEELVQAVMHSRHLYGSIQMLGVLLERQGLDCLVGDLTVRERLELLHRRAAAARYWPAVRYSSSLLRQMINSLSPFVMQILVNGKQVTVGTVGVDFSLFDKPMTPGEIHQALYEKVQPFSIIAAVIQQELLLYCGKLISTNPELFAGILKIRIGWVLHALELYIGMEMSDPPPIETCSPSEIRHLLSEMLKQTKELMLAYGTGVPNDKDDSIEANKDGKRTMSVYEARLLNGCLTRVPDRFYSSMWLILERTPGGIYIGKEHLPQQPTLTQMTSTDLTFAHTIENMLNTIAHPAYKKLSVELFYVLASILRRNPELEFGGRLCADALIQEAIHMFAKDENIEDIEPREAFINSPVMTTCSYMARAIVNSILKGSIMNRFQGKVSDFSCPVQ